MTQEEFAGRFGFPVNTPRHLGGAFVADGNVDLNFIAAQLGKVLDGQREMRAGQNEMRIALAATRGVLALVKLANKA